jgi:O-antigen/teichoic acid export membrane protein
MNPSSSQVLRQADASRTEVDLSSSPVTSESLRSRFARGAIWSLIGTLISQGLTLLAFIVTARFLGKAGLGELGIVNSTVGVFGTFAGLGLGLTTTKYVAEFRTKDAERAGRIIGLTSMIAAASSGLVAIGICLFAHPVATHILNAHELAEELRIGSLLLLLNTMNGVQTGTLSGLEAFREIAQANCLRGLIAFPLMIIGVVSWGLPGAVWGLVASSAVAWSLNHLFLRKKCRKAGISPHVSGIRHEFPILWSFSLPASLAEVAVGPAIWAANAILVNQTNGYAEMGVFSAANQWRNALMFIPNVLLQVALPILSSLDVDSSDSARSRFSNTFEITQTLTLAVVFPLGVLIMFYGDIVIGFYGAQFSNAFPSLVGVTLTVMIIGVSAAGGPAIQARDRMWVGFGLNLIWGTILLSVVWFSAARLGALSLAYSPAIAYMVMAVLTFVVLGPDLEKGALSRGIGAIALSITAAALSLAIPPLLRHILATPILLLSFWTIVFVLSTRHTRHLLFSQVRRSLAARANCSLIKAACSIYRGD